MPAFKAKQILDWVYAKGASDPALMTNLSVRERATLAAEVTFLSGETVKQSVATDGTSKLLAQWNDYSVPAAGAAAVAEGGSALPALPMLGSGAGSTELDS